MTTPDERPRPNGSAWQEEQRGVQARNEEARKRGRQEKAAADKKRTAKRLAAEIGGIFR
jgi:hypothetical protein